jgi:N-hydroxyarylamine O-acetyltransferase
VSAVDTQGYLGRLGVAMPVRPDLDALRTLHAAHAERVAYEAIDIQLGRPTSIAPHDSVDRVLRGRGGYCYHLNGAFSTLLSAVGFDVVWHRAGVQGRAVPTAPGSVSANHLALTVHGLPNEENPAGDWLVDVGLGDALHAPLPLQAGVYEQKPFRFELRPSETDPGGWHFEHDPSGSFIGMDFAPQRATVADFLERHEYLSTSPESGFVRVCAVQRRDALGVDVLTGCVLSRKGEPVTEDRVLDTAADWFAALADVFGLPLADVDPAQRDALWSRIYATHEAWAAER